MSAEEWKRALRAIAKIDAAGNAEPLERLCDRLTQVEEQMGNRIIGPALNALPANPEPGVLDQIEA